MLILYREKIFKNNGFDQDNLLNKENDVRREEAWNYEVVLTKS